MRTSVSILHHDYPTLVRDSVAERLRVLDRYHDHIVTVRARLERQGGGHRVEIVTCIASGPTLVADGRAEGLGGALDRALERMTRLLERAGDKRTARRRRRARSQA